MRAVIAARERLAAGKIAAGLRMNRERADAAVEAQLPHLQAFCDLQACYLFYVSALKKRFSLHINRECFAIIANLRSHPVPREVGHATQLQENSLVRSG